MEKPLAAGHMVWELEGAVVVPGGIEGASSVEAAGEGCGDLQLPLLKLPLDAGLAMVLETVLKPTTATARGHRKVFSR